MHACIMPINIHTFHIEVAASSDLSLHHSHTQKHIFHLHATATSTTTTMNRDISPKVTAAGGGKISIQPIPSKKLMHVYLHSNLLTLCLIPITFFILLQALKINPYVIEQLYIFLKQNVVTTVISSSIFVGFGSAVYLLTRPRPILLVDFSCYKAPAHLKVPLERFMNHSKATGEFDEESLEFQRKILERSGLGDETCVPPALLLVPPQPSMQAAREEAEQVLFGALDNLFANTHLNPKDIGILVVNCSLFNPIPSLSSMIIDKYKLRSDIKSFSLGGMGCSAGVVSIDLAKGLLLVHKNTYAIVVSTENITQNWYLGNQKSMLIPNCLFRVGGSAVLLSNKTTDKIRAKYRLVHVVRTHCGADDNSFRSLYQAQDSNGKSGVYLPRDLKATIGKALKSNVSTLGPLVLPISEKVISFSNGLLNKLYSMDFKLYFDHFCIHAGGRAIIDELEKNLQLSPLHVEASRMTLHRFGNTSSSSIWYELAYIEAKGRMKRGQSVWQIGLGSGFKCNSAVWQALCDVKPSISSPWEDCIDEYPLAVSHM